MIDVDVDFSGWSKDSLLDFVEFFKKNYPFTFPEVYIAYENCLRGD